MSEIKVDEKTARFAAATKAIRGNFDRAATPYTAFEAHNAFFATLMGKLLALAPFPRGSRVLDVGCGTGASTGVILEAVGDSGEVVGIDLSLGMLKEARRNLPKSVALSCMDGCAFGDAFAEAFDAVVYNAVLFMLPDAAASLASAATVLKSGGTVLVSMLDGVFVEGRPVADLLAEKSFEPGRHALSPWNRVEALLAESFSPPQVAIVEVALTPTLFGQFYGLEPMSAGLLPRLPYDQRLAAVTALAGEFEREGKTPVQRWILAAARK